MRKALLMSYGTDFWVDVAPNQGIFAAHLGAKLARIRHFGTILGTDVLLYAHIRWKWKFRMTGLSGSKLTDMRPGRSVNGMYCAYLFPVVESNRMISIRWIEDRRTDQLNNGVAFRAPELFSFESFGRAANRRTEKDWPFAGHCIRSS